MCLLITGRLPPAKKPPAVKESKLTAPIAKVVFIV